MLYLKEIVLFLIVAAIVVSVWYASHRIWQVVGSNLNYAFIILEKTADGALDVYDAHMNPVKNYCLPAKQFDQTIKQRTRFFK